ncbi:MAG: AMIN domain-containing protein [Thermosynechococcaceae cyanobacterium]
MVSQPASAAQTEVTGVQLNPTSGGIQLVLNTQGNQRPPVFTVNRGNSSVADINNTQLRLPDGGEFRETDSNVLPEGIKSISVRQLDSNTIRIQVDGINAAPIADIVRSDGRKGLFVMQFEAGTPDTATASSVPSTARPNSTPPFKGRAIAPPVGDLAIAPLNVDPDKIELGSGRIIPKLLLRDAPVREVVTLLGRAAGVNVAFSEGSEGDTGSTISLDIENESVDDVFNYVIRLSGLQANRVGQTVFVGKELPGDAQNRVVRSVRLNQMKATAKVTSKRSLKSSAETGGSVSGSEENSGSTTASTALDRSSDISEEVEGKGAKEVLEAYGANESGDAVSTLLKGLSVVADARTNSVTLIGTPRKVEVATSLLTQLDVRQRQVAVNVQFIDVNLLKGKLSNTDVRYRANNGLGLGVTGGNFSVNLGDAADIAGNALSGGILGLTNNFLAALQVSIQNNNAKILTNPTLLIQEGSAAQVNLTEQIFSGTRVSDSNNGTSSGATTSTQSVEPIIQNAGVIMNVSVDRIDDNGFVTLNVSPEVSSLSNQTFVDAFGSTANLLQQRRVETGQIRIRDGQTLVMAGIIQDQDRVDVTKVPILGDIPLLGQLFRRTNNTKQRSELVVLITPQIVNDSDQSTYGYNYTPGEEAQKLLKR